MPTFTHTEQEDLELHAILSSVVHSLRLGELEKIEYAALVFNPQTGLIHALYDLSDAAQAAQYTALAVQREIDHRGKIVVPGFVDAHCHAPQYVFTGTGMDLPLLQWLEKYTFPSEARFADNAFARTAYEKSIRRHLQCGTTFASYFATIHAEACRTLVEVIQRVGQRALVGKVSMDRNAPSFYVEDTLRGADEAEEFAQFVLSQSEVGRDFLLQVLARSRSNSSLGIGGKRRTTSFDAASVQRIERDRERDRETEIARADAEQDTTQDSPLSSLSPSPGNEEEQDDEEEREGEDEEDEDELLRIARELLDDTGMCEIRFRGHTLLNKPHAPLVLPCITPRFVPTCTGPLMHRLGNIAARYGLPIQSHMSESVNEIDWVSSLHPECPTYADVYERHGLLNERAFMAHCCHSTDEEMEVLLRTRASVVHCASSNFMLSSGVMDVRLFLERGIHVAIGTDVAGGYSPSMLDAMRQTIVASRVKGLEHNTPGQGPKHYHSLTFAEVFHLATVGGATVLGFGDVIGNFMPGKKLDCLVVDVHAENSPIDTFDHETFHEHFEKFIFLGDDRNIVQVFVDGRQVL